MHCSGSVHARQEWRCFALVVVVRVPGASLTAVLRPSSHTPPPRAYSRGSRGERWMRSNASSGSSPTYPTMRQPRRPTRPRSHVRRAFQWCLQRCRVVGPSWAAPISDRGPNRARSKCSLCRMPLHLRGHEPHAPRTCSSRSLQSGQLQRRTPRRHAFLAWHLSSTGDQILVGHPHRCRPIPCPSFGKARYLLQ
jgi:hypothetical protein